MQDMAAEMDRIIRDLRREGFGTGADRLEELKTVLVTEGLIPERIGIVSDLPPFEFDLRTRRSERDLETMALGLPNRVVWALARGGITSVRQNYTICLWRNFT